MSFQEDVPKENVVARLKRKLREARGMGLRVRMEPLDGEQTNWCEIAGVPTLFVDLSQTAAQQLQQVEEMLGSYIRGHSATEPSDPEADSLPDPDADLAKRAA